MMIATVLVMFLVTHSSETQDILTVSKISVQQHQTIIIPCLYDRKYVSYLKYVSSGSYWFFSSYIKNRRVSVVDNKTENVFTATLRNAELSDTGTYWCGISMSGLDPGSDFYLDVIKGKPRLHVSSQYVSGYEGENADIVCHGASWWCQIGGSCVGRNGGTSDSVVHISADALNVTLRELKREVSGWYYCSDGKSKMPVHITVRTSAYTGRVTVQYTDHTTASGQDMSVQYTDHTTASGQDKSVQYTDHTTASGQDTSVQYTGHTTASGQDKFVQDTGLYSSSTASSQEKSVGLKLVPWLVILGLMLPVIVCAAVILDQSKEKKTKN